jgi:epoxide hydrolase-like predicted phosphatase
MPIRAIFFDIGGVLVRTNDRTPRTRLATRLGTTYDALVDLIWGGERGRQAQRGEISAEEQWINACRVLKWPLEQVQDLESEFFAGDGLDMTLVDYIRSLHTRYRTGIISNALSNVRSAIEKKWDIADAFDALILSAEVGLMKPDPRIFYTALAALGAAPAEAVFVDDFAENVAGAQAVGMFAVQFFNPAQVREEVDRLLAVTQ